MDVLPARRCMFELSRFTFANYLSALLRFTSTNSLFALSRFTFTNGLFATCGGVPHGDLSCVVPKL